jgi:hypothetical protein
MDREQTFFKSLTDQNIEGAVTAATRRARLEHRDFDVWSDGASDGVSYRVQPADAPPPPAHWTKVQTVTAAEAAVPSKTEFRMTLDKEVTDVKKE